MARAKPAQDKLAATGIDRLCEMIQGGYSLAQIAAEVGVGEARIVAWLQADPERSARAKTARALTAQHWDEKAERVLEQAQDAFEVQRARELAQHYRWRAKVVDPKQYGDKIGVEANVTMQLADALEAARKRVKGDE